MRYDYYKRGEMFPVDLFTWGYTSENYEGVEFLVFYVALRLPGAMWDYRAWSDDFGWMHPYLYWAKRPGYGLFGFFRLMKRPA